MIVAVDMATGRTMPEVPANSRDANGHYKGCLHLGCEATRCREFSARQHDIPFVWVHK